MYHLLIVFALQAVHTILNRLTIIIYVTFSDGCEIGDVSCRYAASSGESLSLVDLSECAPMPWATGLVSVLVSSLSSQYFDVDEENDG